MNLENGRNNNPFKYAISGIVQAIKSERNVKVDCIISILVIILGIIFKINQIEWVVCVLLIGIVLTAELMNTAIETVVDMYTREKNEMAKKAKDIAAGAVLIIAIVSGIIGGIIFIPKIFNIFS